MQIIPVIDLKDGCVVGAKFGQRDLYQPIRSCLCASNNAKAIIDALLKIYPFALFYVADINAITGNGSHDREIKDLLCQFPDLEFWIDQGHQHFERHYGEFKNAVPVIGSESLDNSDLAGLNQLKGQYVLSLDFAKDLKLGAMNIFDATRFWPETVIIMTLDRVGSFDGPDFKKLDQFKALYPNKKFVAAGGIRNNEDLLALKNMGIHHTLVASALHSGVIGKKELDNLTD